MRFREVVEVNVLYGECVGSGRSSQWFLRWWEKSQGEMSKVGDVEKGRGPERESMNLYITLLKLKIARRCFICGPSFIES